ncbi:MAG: hypothetical protein ACI9T9_000940 [Oleiphilaceae bacterium]|jgi:hypothetical protein
MTQTIISHEILIKTAGQVRFDQALALFNQKADSNVQNAITDFQYKDKKVSATVDQHKVSIHYHTDTIEGACDCTDSDGFDFCEHCVRLTLHANKSAQKINALAKGPDKSKILAYLLTQDKQALAKQCLELIEKDAEQFKRFVLKAFLDKEIIDYSQLKTQITDLTRKPENLFSQRQVKLFFSKIDLFLEELQLSNYLAMPEKIIKLIEYTFQRINLLLDTIDDSNLQRQTCIEKLQLMYVNLITEITGRPETKAKRLYSFWLYDTHGLLGHDPEIYFTQKNALIKFKELTKNTWKHIQNPKSQATTNANTETLPTQQQNKVVRYLIEGLMQTNQHDKIQPLREFLDRN